MSGKEIHTQVGHLREAGKFDESIKLAEEAKKAYQEEGDMVGLSDLYGDISLSYRHKKDFDKAEAAALEGIKIAEDNNLGGNRARPYFNLAKVREDKGEFANAVSTYKKSIEIFKTQNPTIHNRSGVLADMNIHLFTCEYKAGDKTSLDRALKAIKDLENSNEQTISKYNYDVWLSGAHMKIAENLRNDDPEKAKKHLNIAKEIIFSSDQDLRIRKKQWEELNASFQ